MPKVTQQVSGTARIEIQAARIQVLTLDSHGSPENSAGTSLSKCLLQTFVKCDAVKTLNIRVTGKTAHGIEERFPKIHRSILRLQIYMSDFPHLNPHTTKHLSSPRSTEPQFPVPGSGNDALPPGRAAVRIDVTGAKPLALRPRYDRGSRSGGSCLRPANIGYRLPPPPAVALTVLHWGTYSHLGKQVSAPSHPSAPATAP